MNVFTKSLPGKACNLTYASIPPLSQRLAPQQPVQCFSASALSSRIALFRENFPGDIAYAVKANPSEAVIRSAVHAGLKVFDVASIAEMELVQSQAPDAKLHYHNPVRSRREIEIAWHDYNCRRYSVDEPAELKKLLEIIDQPQDVEIAVRFRLPSSASAVHDFSEKFGLAPDAAAHLLAQVKMCGFIPVLTFHPGSQCLSPQSWRDHIAAAAAIAKAANVEIKTLNVGGGFPVDYDSHAVPDLQLFFHQIRLSAIAEFSHQPPPNLECEPGRAIVAPSVSVLARVKMVRENSREVYLNDGIYGNLMESTQAPDLQPPARLIRSGAYHKCNLVPFVIYGPTCDPLDRLPGTIMLPMDVKEDDYVEFRNVGAYGHATATCFNGYGQSEMIQVDTL